MGTFLSFADLSGLAPDLTEATANLYIADVEALAAVDAPCIIEIDFPYRDAVKAILRQAVLRWHRAGEGGVVSQQQTAGPFGQSTSYDKSAGLGRLWPSEVRQLQALCRQWKQEQGGRRKAFTVLPRPSRRVL